MRFFYLISALALFSTAANSATLNFNSDNRLTGATDLNVEGTLYSVEFKDGTCQSVFSGCDELSDVDFSTEAAARAAGEALLDQVLIGLVDDTPGLQFGCLLGGQDCITLIPFSAQFNFPGSPVIGVNVIRTVNFSSGFPPTVFDNTFSSSPFRANEQTVNGVFSNYVFADFTETGVTSVPLPASGWVLLASLVGLGALRTRGTLAKTS